MAFKIDRLIKPENREKWNQYRDLKAQVEAKVAAMDNDMLACKAEYYISQMPCSRVWGPGAPVYDGVFFNNIVPELLRRIRTLESGQ